EEREELGREDERGRRVLCERRVEHRLGVIAVARGAADQVELLDELPSCLSGEARVVALRRLRAALRRGDRDARARLDDLLRYVGALARHEALARAVRRDGRAARSC